jgi:beta-exotoxin I transport system permease protein
MKPVIIWTLRQRRWSIFWWSLAVFGLIFINMIFYPSFKDQAAQLQESFKNIPDATLQFIGGSADFFSPIGFLNSQIFFLMLPLLLGVLAIGLGSSLLGGEEQDKTIEALLARPVSRNKLLLAKGLAGTIILAWVALVGFVTTAVTAQVVALDISTVKLLMATTACYLLALSFAATAFLVTAFGRARAVSIGVATTLGLGGYIVQSLSGTVDWLKTFSNLLPFHYYQPELILRGTYDWFNALFFIGLIVGAGVLSWLGFRRRDIH